MGGCSFPPRLWVMNLQFVFGGVLLGLLALGGETLAGRLGPSFGGAVLLLELLILPAILLTMIGFVLEPAVAPVVSYPSPRRR
ncbi:MAG: hypothetical protein L3K13_05155 [Thermoplasmata archaeon]|nr:hypothetical protein [Thermoplasmata archaeon]